MSRETPEQLDERAAALRARRAELVPLIAASQAESARVRAERLPLIEERDRIDRDVAKLERRASQERAKARRRAEAATPPVPAPPGNPPSP